MVGWIDGWMIRLKRLLCKTVCGYGAYRFLAAGRKGAFENGNGSEEKEAERTCKSKRYL